MQNISISCNAQNACETSSTRIVLNHSMNSLPLSLSTSLSLFQHTHLLSAEECIMVADFQNQHPNPCKLATNGYFGSKFVTVCVSGNESKQVDLKGYQVCSLLPLTAVFTSTSIPGVQSVYGPGEGRLSGAYSRCPRARLHPRVHL